MSFRCPKATSVTIFVINGYAYTVINANFDAVGSLVPFHLFNTGNVFRHLGVLNRHDCLLNFFFQRRVVIFLISLKKEGFLYIFIAAVKTPLRLPCSRSARLYVLPSYDQRPYLHTLPITRQYQ